MSTPAGGRVDRPTLAHAEGGGAIVNILRAPDSWTPEQIELFRKQFDGMLRRHGYELEPPRRPRPAIVNTDPIPGWWDRNGKNAAIVVIAWILLSAAVLVLGRRAGIL